MIIGHERFDSQWMPAYSLAVMSDKEVFEREIIYALANIKNLGLKHNIVDFIKYVLGDVLGYTRPKDVTEILNHGYITAEMIKNKLNNEIRNRAGDRWRLDHGSLFQALAMGTMLNSEALTIGFCRRFTDYKRPWLILSDVNRLKKIVQNEACPVQIVFSGKAHPNDHHGKTLIQQIYNLARDPEFRGRVVFVEDYDLHLARYLVHGVDLWLNNPRPLQEASGTSGMKAAINGVPNLSIMDGWWYEGYNGSNGWAIRANENICSPDQDKADANELYTLLESTIVPLFYDRDRNGIPHGWLRVVKESIRSITPLFSARRMLKEYVEQMYLPCAEASTRVADNTEEKAGIPSR